MKRLNTLFTIIVLAILTSCKTPSEMAAKPAAKLTKAQIAKLMPVSLAMIKDYYMTNPKLVKSQLFLGGDSIVMERIIKIKGSDVTKTGRIVLKNSEEPEVITIDPYSPCLIIPGGIDSAHRFKISFKPGNNKLSLIFGPSSYDVDHTYVLYVYTDKSGNDWVNYGSNTYQLQSGAGVNLMFLPEDFKTKGTRRKEAGRKLGQ